MNKSDADELNRLSQLSAERLLTDEEYRELDRLLTDDSGEYGKALVESYFANWTVQPAPKKDKAMNVRRGFFRLWLVVSALWVVLALAVTPSNTLRSDFLIALLAAITPPLVLLVLGVVVAWALAGFKRSA